MEKKYAPLNPPDRILLGPGPSNVDDSVLKALSQPLVGHLDPVFLAIMEEVQEMLRHVFMTENHLTIPVSGTGSAGMEAALVNAIEDGDHVLVCISGVFGQRMCDIVKRCSGILTTVETQWGTPIDPAQVQTALAEFPADVVAIVHAETSTGVLQPLEDISRIVHEHDALLLVDAVTSLGGAPLKIDEWGLTSVTPARRNALAAHPVSRRLPSVRGRSINSTGDPPRFSHGIST